MLVRTHCVCIMFWHGQPGFGMDSLHDTPIVRMPACLGSHAVLVRLYTYSVWHGQPV